FYLNPKVKERRANVGRSRIADRGAPSRRTPGSSWTSDFPDISAPDVGDGQLLSVLSSGLY
ncbi:MAG: hypothetical protein AAGE93_27650, partial [Bacteroidota bacterium]